MIDLDLSLATQVAGRKGTSGDALYVVTRIDEPESGESGQGLVICLAQI